MMRSKVGLSQMTAFCALSLTLPLLHFFLPLADDLFAGAAAAFALQTRRTREGGGEGRRQSRLFGRARVSLWTMLWCWRGRKGARRAARAVSGARSRVVGSS